MGRKESIKKEINLSGIPRKHGVGANRNKLIFDWENSLGYSVNGIYNNQEFEVKIINYSSKNQKLTIEYNKHEFDIAINSVVNCNLGRVLGYITSDFKYANEIRLQNSNRDFTIIDNEYRTSYNDDGSVKYKSKYYKYHCNICNWNEGWISESNLKAGYGCSCCAGRTLVEGINDIPTTAPWLIPYFQGGYDEAKLYTKWGYGNVNNPKGYIKPICTECGRIKNKNISIGGIYKNGTFGCSCGDGISMPNKTMFNVLEQLNIDFEAEYSPDWIKPKAYDFYIPSIDKIIEMDGGLGHGNKIHSKDGKTKEETLGIDNYKDKLAKLHDIEVIRIDCNYPNMETRFEYIKQNLLNKKELNKYLNLNNIDWNKCNEYSLSNLVKVACEYKKNNPELTTIEIGKIMKMSTTPIASYLKEGNKLGWCEYNPQKEQDKGRIRGIKKRLKRIEVFKDGISLGEFESAREIDTNSEKLFGIKLNYKNISQVCNGEKRTHKGFIFKFVA